MPGGWGRSGFDDEAVIGNAAKRLKQHMCIRIRPLFRQSLGFQRGVRDSVFSGLRVYLSWASIIPLAAHACVFCLGGATDDTRVMGLLAGSVVRLPSSILGISDTCMYMGGVGKGSEDGRHLFSSYLVFNGHGVPRRAGPEGFVRDSVSMNGVLE